MPRKTCPKTIARLALFAEQFASEFGRKERRKVCAAYLEWLLGVIPVSEPRHALRNFVNRSPWSDENVMRRLRGLMWQQAEASEGWLGLTELTLTKAGAASVGCEPFQRRYRTPPKTRSRQRIIAWFWICQGHAYPVAMRLYLPHRWIRSTSEVAGIPDGLRRYCTTGELARDLLEEISPPESFRHRIIISEHFSRDWDYLTSVFQTADLGVCRLHPMVPWPVMPKAGWALQPVVSWDLMDRYLRIRENLTTWLEANKLRKKRGVAAKRQAKFPNSTDKLLTLNRYLFTHITDEGDGQAFLTNKANRIGGLEIALERFQDLERGAKVLAMMIRQFEGRTWRGIHHHLTLIALAVYAAHGGQDPNDH